MVPKSIGLRRYREAEEFVIVTIDISSVLDRESNAQGLSNCIGRLVARNLLQLNATPLILFASGIANEAGQNSLFGELRPTLRAEPLGSLRGSWSRHV